MSYTPIEDLEKIHAELRQTFLSGLTLPLKFRQSQLLALARMVQENHERFAAAIAEDMGKPAAEVYAAETGPVVERCIISARSLKEWAAPDDKVVPNFQETWQARVYKEPKGVALVIAPWNYPLILSLQPFHGAISAGCCCVLKLSEIAASYASTLAELLPKYLDQRAYRIVCGGVPEVTKLLKLKWDHIFYTGNGTVARIVSAAAAKHLTPLTLELGGKSPVIIDPDYPDLDLAAKRVLYGKIANVGQICVSPDYVILPRGSSPEVVSRFIRGLEKAYNEYFPADSTAGGSPALSSASISHIINSTHFKRVTNLLEKTKGKIVLGGKSDPETLKMEPTAVLFDDGTDDWEGDSLMQGENFGPVLPIVVLNGGIDEAIRRMRKRDHPLVLYAFTENEAVKDQIREGTISGNLVFNDTFMQLSVNELPFGGVGESGHGRQILRYAFDAFSYLRSSVDIPRAMESNPAFAGRYPPFDKAKTEGAKGVTMMRIPDLSELDS